MSKEKNIIEPWCVRGQDRITSVVGVTAVSMKEFFFFSSSRVECVLLDRSILKDQLVLHYNFCISLVMCPLGYGS